MKRKIFPSGGIHLKGILPCTLIKISPFKYLRRRNLVFFVLFFHLLILGPFAQVKGAVRLVPSSSQLTFNPKMKPLYFRNIGKNIFKKDSVFIEGIIKNFDTSRKSIRFLLSNFITNDYDVYLTELTADGHFAITIPLKFSVFDLLFDYGGLMLSFIASPGDNIFLEIDDLQTEVVSYRGSQSVLNNEKQNYNKYRKKDRDYNSFLRNKLAMEQLSPVEYKQYRTSVLSKEDSIYYDYKAKYGFSSELEEIALLENKYLWSGDLLRYSSLHDRNKPVLFPEGHLDQNIKSLINNNKAFGMVVYIGDSGPSVSLEDGPVVSVILGQQLYDYFFTFLKDSPDKLTRCAP